MNQDLQVFRRLDRSSALMDVLEQFKDAIEHGTWPLGQPDSYRERIG